MCVTIFRITLREISDLFEEARDCSETHDGEFHYNLNSFLCRLVQRWLNIVYTWTTPVIHRIPFKLKSP